MLNDLLERLFPWTTRPSSREAVKERLKLVLAYDRAGISPGMLNAMRDDILAVLSRYVEIDDEQLEFAIENSDRTTALIANFPIRRIKKTAEPEPENSSSEEESSPNSPALEESAEVLAEESLEESLEESAPELEELFVEDAPLESPEPPPSTSAPAKKEEKEIESSAPSEPTESPKKTDLPPKSSQKQRKSPKSE
ncbi:cell division topological specificity factor MinE [Roseofilum halophilum]|uniref:cell division topological specificity factor MinE n=1 Tax=Roseofilum halophilum TaxID=3082942 RepID=UPI0024BEE42E|nr:cell division topological specificity factor MinE [Roseofilum halophilum]